MKELKRQERGVIKLLVLFATVAIFIWFMAFIDAFEWFYDHSRRYEIYDYDEFIFLFILFSIIGMFWAGLRFYNKAVCGPDNNILSGKQLSRPETNFFSGAQKKTVQTLENSYHSPIFLFISLILVIGAIELLDMFFLHQMPALPYHLETILDTGFLLLLSAPAIYFTFFRPLLHQVFSREQAEDRLRQLNLELEEQVNRRTEQLNRELDEKKKVEAKIIANQKQLRSLASQLTMAEEREKNRIANELHNNLGHTLAIVNNRLSLISSSLSNGQLKDIQDIKEYIIDSIRFTRTLSSALSTPLLNDQPFVETLDWLAEEILANNNIQYTLDAEGTPELPDGDIRIIVLKAIKEILVNIVKHAKADKVKICTKTEVDRLTVEINDNGQGFNVSEVMNIAPTEKLGIGLYNIREQILSLDGSFSLNSSPGQGTTAVLSVPVKTGSEK